MDTYTKEQLIKAQQKYNEEFLANPNDFKDSVEAGEDCAVAQVEKLLSLVG